MTDVREIWLIKQPTGEVVAHVAIPDAIPERCPVALGDWQCVREFGHKGLHRDAGVPVPNPHEDLR